MNNIAIRVQNLSKCYEIYNAPRDRLEQFVVKHANRAGHVIEEAGQTAIGIVRASGRSLRFTRTLV